MYSSVKKKVLGTAVYLGLLVLISSAAAYGVQAKFLNTSRLINFEGVVTQVLGYSLTVQAAGNSVVTVNGIPGSTIIGGDAEDWADFAPGDGITVLGIQEGDAVTARIIKKIAGAGYGAQGPSVMLSRGKVVAKGSSSFSVDIGSTVVTVQVSLTTRFMGGSFPGLTVGKTVSVIGHDTGTQVIATTVHIL